MDKAAFRLFSQVLAIKQKNTSKEKKLLTQNTGIPASQNIVFKKQFNSYMTEHIFSTKTRRIIYLLEKGLY